MADTLLSYVVGGNINGRAPTSIIGRSPVVVSAITSKVNLVTARISAGAMTAGVLKALVSLSVPGVLKIFALESLNATSRKLQAQIVIDGVTVLDATSAAISSTGAGVIYVGYISSQASDNWIVGDRIPFNTLTINAATSTTDSQLGYYLVYDLV